jgi:transcriptional regulator with XRE-family HTH domain
MASPTLRRKTLGAELRKLRSSNDDTAEEIAELLGCSPGKIRHIENGRNSPSKTELMVLMDRYKVPENNRVLLEETRKEAAKRGWWSTYRLPTWFQDFVGLETDAVLARTFQLELIPGLLQTEEYARAVNVLGTHMVKPERVDREVKARQRRQQRLFEQNSLELCAVISEAALRRCAGDTTVAQKQFRHLIEMIKRPNITIRVLPFSRGLHESMSGSFTLLDFPSGTWLRSAYQEYAVGGHFIDDDDAVASLDTLFVELQRQALSEEDSASLITELIAASGGG